MQNLLRNQGPEGACNTDLHELQKKCHLNCHMTETDRKTTFSILNTFFEISVYTKLNVFKDLEFIIQAFSFHYAMKSLYTI